LVLTVTVFSLLFFLRPPASTLFPYTTLFRSHHTAQPAGVVVPEAHDEGRVLAKILWRLHPLAPVVMTHVGPLATLVRGRPCPNRDRKSTRLNSSHGSISYAVFCLKKKKKIHH